jgi:hypothetical protein
MSDCRYFNNLAGKYRVGYGTPFDLEELSGENGLDLNSITHVKIVDVIGSINPQIGSFDSHGNIINDLFPTEFPSGGFDLDAVGVIHQGPLGLIENEITNSIYPNPSNGSITIKISEPTDLKIVDILGNEIYSEKLVDSKSVDLKEFRLDFLVVELRNSKGLKTNKITFLNN